MASASTGKASKASKASQEPGFAHPACFTDTHGVVTSTMNDLPGYRIVEVLGTVYGLTVRARNWGADIGGALRSAVGGELTVFTRLLYTTRNEAMERAVGECLARGGNAIVALRFDVASLGACSQICAYGTACRVEPLVRQSETEPRPSSG